MEVALRDARRPQAEVPERGTPDAVWDVAGIMSKDILPGAPAERRRRSRLCALRAMDRLGLLGEENLIATLAGRPRLRWLADEGGARWDVLAELGRIGEPEAFEAAVDWTLENRPRPEQARAYLCRFRSGAIRLPADAGRAGRSLFTEGVASGPHPRRATGKEERRRC
jgi:hypothetical protein